MPVFSRPACIVLFLCCGLSLSLIVSGVMIVECHGLLNSRFSMNSRYRNCFG